WRRAANLAREIQREVQMRGFKTRPPLFLTTARELLEKGLAAPVASVWDVRGEEAPEKREPWIGALGRVSNELIRRSQLGWDAKVAPDPRAARPKMPDTEQAVSRKEERQRAAEHEAALAELDERLAEMTALEQEMQRQAEEEVG